ncbi:hypothetical protein HOA55_05205 [archaeon]|jgi:uncharacterized membrane protein|nr:hypothetical protein [archaeon]MBT3577719.1 hypothetical protein [archaeon]MBT6820726.1 hypothetical protein [archaeon]MBT6955902.1 hypothetical protein [archaeon]MBT7025866.1 hypothetical protein [archaeon]
MEISSKRLIFGFVAVFLLGVMFSLVNGYYASEEGSTLPVIVYAISFVSIVIGGFIVVLFQARINRIQLNRVLKILPEKEKKIIELLLGNNNSMEQNKLVALTGINKVKMSRILTDLEFRHVVSRTNLGNTKLIVLSV